MYPQRGKNLLAARLEMGCTCTDPSDLQVSMRGVELSLRDVQVGRCSSKAFGVAWDSPGGLCSHTLLPGETYLGLGSALNVVPSLGRTGSTAGVALVQDSSDEILFLKDFFSDEIFFSLGAGFWSWVDVRLLIALPPDLLLFVSLSINVRAVHRGDAAHSSLCRAANSHSVTSRPVHLSCLLLPQSWVSSVQGLALWDSGHHPWYLCTAQPSCSGCGDGEV